jgi:ketosteroid isomerase-like protein
MRSGVRAVDAHPANAIEASERIETYVRAWHEFERGGEAGHLARMFSEDAELLHKPTEDLYRGRDGALQYWGDVRARVRTMLTLVTHIVEAEGAAVLEWYADAVTHADRKVRFSGATVLEFDADERVRRLRTYYDAGPLQALRH